MASSTNKKSASSIHSHQQLKDRLQTAPCKALSDLKLVDTQLATTTREPPTMARRELSPFYKQWLESSSPQAKLRKDPRYHSFKGLVQSTPYQVSCVGYRPSTLSEAFGLYFAPGRQDPLFQGPAEFWAATPQGHFVSLMSAMGREYDG